MGFFKFAIVVLFVSVLLGYFNYKNPSYNKYVPENVQVWIDQQVNFLQDKLKSKTQEKSKSLKDDKEERIFTKDELWDDYRGTEGSKGLYLAFMGKVYDVSKGKDYYAPGGGYSFFSGRDGTKAFSTGEFNDAGLIDDISDLSAASLVEMSSWINLYEKDYIYKGKVIGFFYDANGQKTEAHKDILKTIKKGEEEKAMEEERRKILPGCNSEWKQETGARVWCTKKSAGVHRDWAGVPRLLHMPGHPDPTCACIRNTGPPSPALADLIGKTSGNNGDLDYPYLKEYDNCKPTAVECMIGR